MCIRDRPIKDHRAVILYHIREAVVFCVEDSGKRTFQIQSQKFFFPALKQRFLILFTLPGSLRLGGGHKIQDVYKRQIYLFSAYLSSFYSINLHFI